MNKIEELNKQILDVDKEIARLLEQRMGYAQDIIQYKKENGIAVFNPAQDGEQKRALKQVYAGTPYEREKKAVFKRVSVMGKKVQAKELLPCNIALIGFMGCGKSTVSYYLQKKLAMNVAEVDEMIVEKEGMSIPDIFEKYGEPYFRNCESNMVIELQKRELTIISCGGGLVMRQENVDNLKKNSKIVLLTAKPETIYERVKHTTNRPILNGNMNVEYIAELMEKRRAKYEAAADIVIQTDNRSVQDICEELIRRIQ